MIRIEKKNSLEYYSKEVIPENEITVDRSKYAVIKSVGYSIEAKFPHGCNCEFCTETETNSFYFPEKPTNHEIVSAVQKEASLFGVEWDRVELDTDDLDDGWFCVRMVRQEGVW